MLTTAKRLKLTQYWEAYNNRGKVKGDLGDKRAIADYDRVIAINPKYAPAYHARRYEVWLRRQAGAILTKQSIAIDPEYADAYNNRGNAKSDLGDYRGAISDHNEVIAIDPLYFRAYHNRGCQAFGDKRAISDYSKALKLTYNINVPRMI